MIQAIRCWRNLSFTRGDLDAVTQLFLNNAGISLVIAASLTVGFDPSYNGKYTSWYSSVMTSDPSFKETVQTNTADLVFTKTIVGLALALVVGSCTTRGWRFESVAMNKR